MQGLADSSSVDLGSCLVHGNFGPVQNLGSQHKVLDVPVSNAVMGNGAKLERRITLAVGRWRMWSRRVPDCPASRNLEVQAARVEHKVTIR